MKEVSFKIGRTRDGVFSKEELSKVQAGLDIFLQSINSPLFKKEIMAYHWRDAAGRFYERIHLCKALTNQQVYQCFENMPSAFGTDKPLTIAILPCKTRKDISAYLHISAPTIWINKGCLHQDWYTAVHVASCIAHEYCTNLGFNAGTINGLVPQYENTVPYACGDIIKRVAAQWKNSVTDIRDSFDEIDDSKIYEYLPCSTTFQLKGMMAERDDFNQKMKELKEMLHQEIKGLKNQEAYTSQEFSRLCALEKSIYHLQKIQHKLKKTSLDGMDSIADTPKEEINIEK